MRPARSASPQRSSASADFGAGASARVDQAGEIRLAPRAPRRLAENMQPIADAHIFKVAQPRVETL